MDPKIQVPVLEASAKLAEPSSYRFFTIDLQGNVIARSDGNKLKNYSDRAYFRSILEGEEFGQQIVLGRISGRPALCLSVPIRSVPLKQLVGVLAGCADLIDISNSATKMLSSMANPWEFLVKSHRILVIILFFKEVEMESKLFLPIKIKGVKSLALSSLSNWAGLW